MVRSIIPFYQLNYGNVHIFFPFFCPHCCNEEQRRQQSIKEQKNRKQKIKEQDTENKKTEKQKNRKKSSSREEMPCLMRGNLHRICRWPTTVVLQGPRRQPNSPLRRRGTTRKSSDRTGATWINGFDVLAASGEEIADDEAMNRTLCTLHKVSYVDLLSKRKKKRKTASHAHCTQRSSLWFHREKQIGFQPSFSFSFFFLQK